ncbi:MAG: Phage integrase [Herbaspirillum sp.]|nr:Phage integrase [Herbaspirillum sp.]
MPKVAKELGALAVSRITVPGMHPVGKVAGLNLQVSQTGSRSWILRAMVGDHRREIGLGAFPAVSLQEARERAQAERDKIKSGIDPVFEKRAAASQLKANQELEVTFTDAARRCIAAKAPGWKNAKHGEQWRATIEAYAQPIIGNMLVRHITREHVLKILEPIWTTKTETASRLRGRIEAVLDGRALKVSGPARTRPRGAVTWINCFRVRTRQSASGTIRRCRPARSATLCKICAGLKRMARAALSSLF